MTRTAPDAPAAGATSATHAAAIAGTTSIPAATLGGATMQAFFISGGSRAGLREVPIPQPGRGNVLLRARASTICGSDLRAIYHEHLGSGPEAYQRAVGGHEHCATAKTTPSHAGISRVSTRWLDISLAASSITTHSPRCCGKKAAAQP